jgi:hypothetical protein
MSKPLMILVAGPYRSGTRDDPALIAGNVSAMTATALQLFRAGHLPVMGEWFALPLIEQAGSKGIGDAAFDEIFHPVARRLVARCDGCLRIGGSSAGADEMVALARHHGKAVYQSLAEIPGADTDLETLRELNKRFIHNFVTNDVASHDAILHPGFTSITTTGAHVDRATYLRHWRTGFDPKVITYWDMRDERITVVGDTALVRATNRWVREAQGAAVTGMTCYTDTYVRVGARWLCIQAQLTPVAEANYPPDGTIVCRYHHGVRIDPSGDDA